MTRSLITAFFEAGRLFIRANSWDSNDAYSTKTFSTAGEAEAWLKTMKAIHD